MSIFRRFSLSIGCTLRLVVMCVLLLGLTSCFIGKHAFEMSRNYRPVYNPGGHLFEEDEDFARSYELYKKRREDLQNSADPTVHREQKKRLTDAEKRKVVRKLRGHGVKVATVDDNKGDMVNNEGIDLSRVKGARFIDIDLNEIAKLKAKDRAKADSAEADKQNVEEKGVGDQKESLREEGAVGSRLHEEVSEQEAGAAAESEGQQQGDVDDLGPGTADEEGEDFLSEEEDEDQQYAGNDELESGIADGEGEDFLSSEEEDEDQRYEGESKLESGVADAESEDFLSEEDEGQQYEDEDGLEAGTADEEGEDFLLGEEEDQQYEDEDELEYDIADDEEEDFLLSEEEDEDRQFEDASGLEQDSGSIEHVANTVSDAGSTLSSSGNGVEGSYGSSGYQSSYSSAYCSGTGGGFYFSIDDECCDTDGEANCDSDEGYIFGHR